MSSAEHPGTWPVSLTPNLADPWLATRGLTTSPVVREHLSERLARRRRYLIGGGLIGLVLGAPIIGLAAPVATALFAGLASELRWADGSTAADGADGWATSERRTVGHRLSGWVALGVTASLVLLSLRAHVTHVHHAALAVSFILAIPLLLAVALRLINRRRGHWQSGDALVDQAIDAELVQHANGAAVALLLLTALGILHRFVPTSTGGSGSLLHAFGGFAFWELTFFGTVVLGWVAPVWTWWRLTRPKPVA